MVIGIPECRSERDSNIGFGEISVVFGRQTLSFLALLILIRGIPHPILGSETLYPDEGFWCFSSVPKGIC